MNIREKVKFRTAMHYTVIFMSMLFSSEILHAEELSTFELTGVEGSVFLRHFTDEQENINAGVVQDLDERTISELEVEVNTHSFVYHPNFLRMDIGGGPVFVSNEITELGGNSKVDEVLFNFNAHLNFLESKPYPFSVYLERRNPLIAPSINEHLLQENTKFGAKASIRKPISPVRITAEVFRLTTKGDGINLVIDDEIDQFDLRFYKSEHRGGYNQLILQSNRHLSKSGSKQRDIEANEVVTHALNFDSRLIFGKKDEFILKNLFSYVDQDSVPSLQQIKYSPDLRWNHTESFYSFYRYDFLNSTQENNLQDFDTTNHSAVAGLSNQREEGLSSYADVHVSANESTGFDLTSTGITGSLDYTYPFKYAKLKLHGKLGYDDFDRKSVAGQASVQVFGEKHVLDGIDADNLNNDFIIAISTNLPADENLDITVSNINRSQVFIEGTDYRIIVIGSVTQIQRLLGGAILDGEEVLVDYKYRTGGTFSHTNTDQEYQANLLISNYVNVFAGVSKKDIDLKSGTPGITLNSIKNTSYGITADYPVMESLTVGGEFRIEDQEEDLSPFERESQSVYLQFNLPLATSLRLTGQQERVDHASSLEDVDLTRYSIRLRARPFLRTIVTLSAIDEEDVGGSIPRELRDIILKGEWRFRQLYFSLDIRNNKEIQGDFSRERNIFRATLERRFR